MTISPTSLANAIHGLSHSKPTHPHAPSGRLQQFGQQVTTAMGQAGQQSAASKSSAGASADPGGLLSADMLQAIQAIG